MGGSGKNKNRKSNPSGVIYLRFRCSVFTIKQAGKNYGRERSKGRGTPVFYKKNQSGAEVAVSPQSGNRAADQAQKSVGAAYLILINRTALVFQ